MDGADNALADALFEDVLGPDYWVPDAGISRRTWEILLLRKGCLDGRFWSLAECADRYGISRERIRQIETSGVKALLATVSAGAAAAPTEVGAEMQELSCAAPPPAKRRMKRNVVQKFASRRLHPFRSFGVFECARMEMPPPPTGRRTFERLRAQVLARIGENVD